jgi:hypothetical protein
MHERLIDADALSITLLITIIIIFVLRETITIVKQRTIIISYTRKHIKGVLVHTESIYNYQKQCHQHQL